VSKHNDVEAFGEDSFNASYILSFGTAEVISLSYSSYLYAGVHRLGSIVSHRDAVNRAAKEENRKFTWPKSNQRPSPCDICKKMEGTAKGYVVFFKTDYNFTREAELLKGMYHIIKVFVLTMK
jgi:hypothetical protein